MTVLGDEGYTRTGAERIGEEEEKRKRTEKEEEEESNRGNSPVNGELYPNSVSASAHWCTSPLSPEDSTRGWQPSPVRARFALRGERRRGITQGEGREAWNLRMRTSQSLSEPHSPRVGSEEDVMTSAKMHARCSCGDPRSVVPVGIEMCTGGQKLALARRRPGKRQWKQGNRGRGGLGVECACGAREEVL
ncbi:hypothetical protein B0H13DRAFT_1898878 [Mycena leptocephala]|nr:hypothetical protein B0H13DRAFT_1898878 [Mycena leptocephala]